MKEQRFALRKLAVGLASVGLGMVSTQVVMDQINPIIVYAEEQDQETNLDQQKTTILEKARVLENNDLPDDSILRAELDNVTNDRSPEEQTRNLDTMSLKFELVDESLTHLNDFYRGQEGSKELKFSNIYPNQGQSTESNPTPRYSLQEVDPFVHLTSVENEIRDLGSRYHIPLNINNLVEKKDGIIRDIETVKPYLPEMLDVRTKYNELVSYFNAQHEEKRKAQYEDFVGERANSLYYEVLSTHQYTDRKAILVKLQELDNRIRGNVIDETRRNQLAATLEKKKAEVIEEMKLLPFISLEGDGSYLKVGEYGQASYENKSLSDTASPQEADRYEAEKLVQWDHFLDQIKAVSEIYVKANAFEKEQGSGKEYHLEVYDTSVARPSNSNKPSAATPSLEESEEYVAPKVAVEPIDLDFDSSYGYERSYISQILASSDTTGIEENKKKALEVIDFAKKKRVHVQEVVEAYNRIIDRINIEYIDSERHAKWYQLTYLKYSDTYEFMYNLVQLRKAKTEVEVEQEKAKVLASLAEYEAKYEKEKFSNPIYFKRQEILKRVASLPNNDLTDRRILLDKIGLYRPSITDKVSPAEEQEIIENLDTLDFKLELLDDVLTHLNAFYQKAGSLTRLHFSDLLDKGSKIPRYTLVALTDILTKENLDLENFLKLSPTEKDENKFARVRNQLVERIEQTEKKLMELQPLQKHYNEIVTYFNAQDQAKRKEQFNAFADKEAQAILTAIHQLENLDQQALSNRLTQLERKVKGLKDETPTTALPETAHNSTLIDNQSPKLNEQGNASSSNAISENQAGSNSITTSNTDISSVERDKDETTSNANRDGQSENHQNQSGTLTSADQSSLQSSQQGAWMISQSRNDTVQSNQLSVSQYNGSSYLANTGSSDSSSTTEMDPSALVYSKQGMTAKQLPKTGESLSALSFTSFLSLASGIILFKKKS